MLPLAKEVDNALEIGDGIFTFHVREHGVAAGLDGNVKEGVDSRMVENVSNRLHEVAISV